MKIYNHEVFKMGKYESELAKHIPEGGNWKNIPESFNDVRLESIRKTGGRTTYYGRLRWDKPSYTIATYFNRVGNGCNLHPDQMRVMSNREAARLQSFPDDFVFTGSKASQYKQIGNAVPPLLARFVSSLIKPYLSSYNFIDLFAGCGGMSEGFLMNGFNLIAANEFDKNIFSTYIYNHSKYCDSNSFILGDVTTDEVKKSIIQACDGKHVDVIIGGPPCQGFSTAGWRNPEDKRNQLFKEYVFLVNKIRPKFFIMENVIGILSMRGGDAVKEIIESFSEIGYTVSYPIKLNAADFGVPQRRKRVFIIGSLDGVTINQPAPLFSENEPTTLFTGVHQPLPGYVTVRDAIGSLPPVEDGGGAKEMDFEINEPSLYDRLMAREISFEEFYEGCKQIMER